MTPRERGSRTLAHNPTDPLCEKASGVGMDEDAVCELCGVNQAREQARAAFNLRELGS